jgi:hypothetical protein
MKLGRNGLDDDLLSQQNGRAYQDAKKNSTAYIQRGSRASTMVRVLAILDERLERNERS